MNSLQFFDRFFGRQDEMVCNVVLEAVNFALQFVQTCRNVTSLAAQLRDDPIDGVAALARVLRDSVNDDALLKDIG